MNDNADVTIRRAAPDDYAAVTALVDAAYSKYIERIGRKPLPMLADYAHLIAQGVVHVLQDEAGVRGCWCWSGKKTIF